MPVFFALKNGRINLEPEIKLYENQDYKIYPDNSRQTLLKEKNGYLFVISNLRNLEYKIFEENGRQIKKQDIGSKLTIINTSKEEPQIIHEQYLYYQDEKIRRASDFAVY
ncbi:MAG: hypothetical protein ACOCQG_02085 [Candidatus Nanoarchaeia archaeon]